MGNTCKICSADLNFLSFYNIAGNKYCFKCYKNALIRLNGNKKLPAGYGKLLKILEVMFRLSVTKYKVISNKQLRQIAIKQVKKKYPVIFSGDIL